MYEDVLSVRDLVSACLVLPFDVDLTRTADRAPELNHAVDLRHDSRFFGPARLEQFGDAG